MAISTGISERIALVTIERPARGNSIDPETHCELAELWPALEQDPGVGAIILTGHGDRTFCAGADVHSFLPYLADLIMRGQDPGHFCGLTDQPLSKPLIAAVNGAAIGGGLELALAADIRIAADTASFGLPEVGLGAIAGAGGITRLSRAIPQAVANHMILTGEVISAQRAFQLGLVSEILAPAELLQRAHNIAKRILTNGPLAVSVCRDILQKIAGIPLRDALATERAGFHTTIASDDFSIGVASFGRTTPPAFTGR